MRIFLILVILVGIVHAAPVKWASNGRWYDVSTDSAATWTAARDAAAARTYTDPGTGITYRGYLACINSAAENSFLVSTFNVHAWIGAYQPSGSPEPSGNWSWVTGEAWSYSNWNAGEPNNVGTEDYGEFYVGGAWNDIPHSHSQVYYIEYGTAITTPILSASNTNFGNVRVGTSATASVTVTNSGNTGSTLTGTIGAASGSEIIPNSGTQSFSLGQNLSSTRTYTYTPATRGADSTTISISSNAGSTTRTLTGTGVSPVYSSSVAPNSTIDFGTVEAYSYNEYVLRIQNITPDSELGNLTNMTLLSAAISGIDASWFSIENFTPGTVLGKNGYIDLVLRATNPEWRWIFRNATLTIVTDENAAFGADRKSVV